MLDGITLVISPLISLMKDQVGSLNQAGIHAAYLNSSLTPGQYRKALAFARQGKYPIIYVAPERLLTPEFLDFAMNVRISMVAVDEAHCVSTSGDTISAELLKDRGLYPGTSGASCGQRLYSYSHKRGTGRHSGAFGASGSYGHVHWI